MINRREFLLSAAALAAPRRPNIIFLLVDDLGWRDFGCTGNEWYETPNIDRIARRGMRFTNAYAACPVCSPTRASILTGKYPARLRLTDWIPGREQWPAAKLLTPAFEQQLPLAEITIPEMLKPLGYRSAAIGKWHLGGAGFHPEQQGFDLNVGGDHRGAPPSYLGPLQLPNLEVKQGEELTEQLTAAAERFIRETAGKQPFFAYLAEYTVHLPLQARERLVDKYRAKPGAGLPGHNPIYAAMVESLDIAVGRIDSLLGELGIAGDTIWIITSDNGGLRYEGGGKRPVTDNRPLRAGKGHLYEGGIREPLIVDWPGVTPAGSVCEEVVTSVDFLPTIAAMAGAKAPRGIDGENIAPLLKGGRRTKPRPVYWHYPHYSNQGGVPGGAVRLGNDKLIEFYEDSRLELYDLAADPGETRNLARRNAARAAELHGMLKRWRASVGASMPKQNPDYDPAKADQGLTGTEPPTPPQPE